MTSTAIVAYLALFATVGFLFVLGSLLLGKLLRAWEPTAAKNETYECGEPAVGPGSVQFDLRFYVVALLFLIFEVEVAFFFPPAAVFGKVNRLRDSQNASSAQVEQTYQELGIPKGTVPFLLGQKSGQSPATGESGQSLWTTLAVSSMVDLGVFFAVLLVGFAYLWRCGDLDWVRAVTHPSTTVEAPLQPAEFQEYRIGDGGRPPRGSGGRPPLRA